MINVDTRREKNDVEIQCDSLPDFREWLNFK